MLPNQNNTPKTFSALNIGGIIELRKPGVQYNYIQHTKTFSAKKWPKKFTKLPKL